MPQKICHRSYYAVAVGRSRCTLCIFTCLVESSTCILQGLAGEGGEPGLQGVPGTKVGCFTLFHVMNYKCLASNTDYCV